MTLTAISEPQPSTPVGESYHYVGTELDLFAKAVRWKAYLRRQIAPYLGRHVLEVGAGIGGTTKALFQQSVERWVALEPDAVLAGRYEAARQRGELPACCEAVVGTTSEIDSSQQFDSILYIDVLEHIEEDRAELARAAQLLSPGGNLIVLAPAHNYLMSEFDRSVGHCRRYSRRSLASLSPPGVSLTRLIYLDSVGLLASLANRWLLRSPMPTPGQIAFWDSTLVRASTWLDPCLGRRVGKSVLAVWRR